MGRAEPDAEDGLTALRNEAKALRTVVSSSLGNAFLDATAYLPAIAERTLYHDEGRMHYYGPEELNALDAGAREHLTKMPVTEAFYYTTKYGTPLAYVRALELYAGIKNENLSGKRILDFGNGTVGHLRLMALCGADVVGVEVDPLLPKLYGAPEDHGAVQGGDGPTGHVKLVHGRFPGIAGEVGEGFDLITSKNTLKNGFFHPEQPVPKNRLVDLGVEVDAFVKTIHGLLKPGGVFLIYNICPAPSKPGEPYKHWADGRCPFPRSMLADAGFTVLEYNKNDDEATRLMARALRWDTGDYAMDLENDLFGSYTIAVKKAATEKD